MRIGPDWSIQRAKWLKWNWKPGTFSFPSWSPGFQVKTENIDDAHISFLAPLLSDPLLFFSHSSKFLLDNGKLGLGWVRAMDTSMDQYRSTKTQNVCGWISNQRRDSRIFKFPPNSSLLTEYLGFTFQISPCQGCSIGPDCSFQRAKLLEWNWNPGTLSQDSQV